MSSGINAKNQDKLILSGNWKNSTYWNLYKAFELPRGSISTSVCGLVIWDDKIVLVKNNRGWELPGGHLELGESIKMALIRELYEEIGLQDFKFIEMYGYIEIINPNKLKINKATKLPYPKRSYNPYYLIKAAKKPIGCQDGSCHKIGFFSINDKEIKSSKDRDIIFLTYSSYLANID